MKTGDVITGGAAAVLGGAVLAMSFTFPKMADGAPGPALFPQVLSAALLGFGLVVIWQSRSGSYDSGEVHERAGIIAGLLILLAIGIYIFTVQYLGFIIAGSALVLFIMLLLRVKPLTAVLSTLLIVGFSVVLFGKLLRVPLQQGLLGF